MASGNNYTSKQVGNYTLLEELASGTFGSVYRGQHVFLSKHIVAIKLLRTMHLGSQEERDQFLQEAQILAKLNHHYILSFVDFGILDEGFPYLVTEYAPNGSLRDRLKRQSPHPLLAEEALAILSQTGQALEYAHQQNIIHRDLKPENILFNAKGEALLADFGIATVLTTASVKQTTIAGTPHYMAPEQFKGEVSRQSDQYALGCIAYELFTGRKPFTAPDLISLMFKHVTEQPPAPRQLNPQLPLHIEQTILKAMAKERADRHSDVHTFITAVAQTSIQGHSQQPPVDAEELSATVLASTQLSPRKIKERWLEKGNVHYKAGQFAESLTAYEQAIQADPNDTSAWHQKADVLKHLKRYTEALDAYERTIQLDPDAVEAWYHKADVLKHLKRYTEALDAYEHTIQLAPNAVEAWYHKADVLKHLKRYAEALDAYEHTIQLAPNAVQAYIGRGETCYSLKRHQQALTSYEQAIQLAPSAAEAYTGKGNALHRLKRHQQALTSYEQAIQLAPSAAEAYIGKGYALCDLGYNEEALAAYEQAIQLTPNLTEAYIGKGHVLCNLGGYKEALAVCEQAIRLDPHDALAHNGRGNALNSLKRYEEALKACQQAMQLQPNEAIFHNNIGVALKGLKRYEEALDACERAIQLNPNFPLAWHNKGDMLKQLGRPKESKQAYQRARELGYSG